MFEVNDNKTSDLDAPGHVTSYQYDTLNRLTLTTYPSQPATTSSKTYDFRGNVLTETDQTGNITKHQYDLAGRLVSLTRGFGTSNAATTTYTYDSDGKKETETDALSHTTTYSYDAADNRISVAGVNGNFQYGYDNARNQVSATDANNYTTNYLLDTRKRLVKTTYPDSTVKTNSYKVPGDLVNVTASLPCYRQYRDTRTRLAQRAIGRWLPR